MKIYRFKQYYTTVNIIPWHWAKVNDIFHLASFYCLTISVYVTLAKFIEYLFFEQNLNVKFSVSLLFNMHSSFTQKRWRSWCRASCTCWPWPPSAWTTSWCSSRFLWDCVRRWDCASTNLNGRKWFGSPRSELSKNRAQTTAGYVSRFVLFTLILLPL